MSDLSVNVDLDEVDGKSLPFKTSEEILALLKLDNQDVVIIDLLFPAHSGTQIGEEGILGWYRPLCCAAGGNENLGLSKIFFLQETLRCKAGYFFSVRNELEDYRMVLNCKKMSNTA